MLRSIRPKRPRGSMPSLRETTATSDNAVRLSGASVSVFRTGGTLSSSQGRSAFPSSDLLPFRATGDASYIELVPRAGIPLATLDAPLRGAAQASGVPLDQP
jgi:hypothetical protein